ncbi:hypothetical protein DZC72_01450 [Maribacter algicola]|uniref:Uncharacterized protein n=1 Tax=Maribacter algicola TaxID=2498892 RepID=A0A3R8RNI6_9FLAO|nr:hypothetical protein [Maribacter algicola]RRQ49318.1 hypothetical protein DZC72_01450 [Maribacter algicola]
MKKIFLLATIALSTTIVTAQYSGQALSNASSGGSMDGSAAVINTLLGDISSRDAKRTKNYDEFQGSPYVSNNFKQTRISYNDEDMGTMFYRYNALNEEIEIKNTLLEEEGIKGLSRDKNISILVDNKKLSFKTFVTSKNNTLNGYLLQLIDGKTYDLYKRTRVKFTEGKPAPNSFVKAVPARFSQFTEYYFQKEGVNRIDEIPLSNNKLLKLLSGNDKESLKNYLKENKIKIKEEEDLIKAFNFLNTL